jgi:nucleoside-diphosphate-sugar epimerase
MTYKNNKSCLAHNKTALICGGAGFIGVHLAARLKNSGYYVVCADIKNNQYIYENLYCDKFIIADFREENDCIALKSLDKYPFDEIYQLSSDMGGVGFLTTSTAELMTNNVLINANLLRFLSKSSFNGKYFFASSVYIYPDTKDEKGEIEEDFGSVFVPNSVYGFEKLYSEKMVLENAKANGFEPRIARFENTYGEFNAWKGGRERAPAAISRKIAMAKDGDSIEVWGDGLARRSFLYIDDLVDGILALMESDIETPTNIGSLEYVTVDKLVETIAKVANKNITIEHISGPVGTINQIYSKKKICSLNWNPKYSLEEGIKKLYPWVMEQVQNEKFFRLKC